MWQRSLAMTEAKLYEAMNAVAYEGIELEDPWTVDTRLVDHAAILR